MLTAWIAAGCLALAVWQLVPSAGAVRMRALGGDELSHEVHPRTWPFFGRSRFPNVDPQRRFIHALRALAAELTSGSTPTTALERAAGEPPSWPRALAAARFGESVAGGLRQDAQANPKLAQQLRQLAACWDVGVTHGAGLASSIERLALSAQTQFELRAVLRSELAAPRATSRMLSLLPIVGMAMGYLLGADPIGWFIGSPVGAMVLAAAILLTVIGALWSRRIVQRVDRALVEG